MNELVDAPPRSFRFGPFVLMPDRHVLQRHDVPVRIGGRALALLAVLVEHAGTLVSRQTLMARVWPDAVVDDSNLKVNIAALRRALGDADAYVATVNGRGYRFVAPVQAEGPVAPQCDAPAGSAAPTPPLPLGPARIFGRVYAIESIAGELENARLVSIVGPGGIGKTTVALAIAERLRGTFTDGARLIDLAKLEDPALVPHAVATALGAGVTSTDLLAATCDFLAERRMLLVLDNCEHVVAAAACCVARILACAPDVRILATSREPLMDAHERVRHLPGLTAPPEGQRLHAATAQRYPAVQLFVERAAERFENYRLSDTDAPAVAEICRRLDGLALALELAATRVDVFGVGGLLAQLNERLPVPAGRRAGPARHRTLAATIDWSIGLLTARDAEVLRALAAFSGPFDARAAAAVAGRSPDEASATLALLAGKSLIATERHGDAVAYRLLETTRSHCLAQLSVREELHAVRQRHADHVCAVLELASAEWSQLPAGDWGAAYGPVVDDLRAALDWAGQSPRNRTLGIRLTLAGILLWNHFSLTEECRLRVSKAAQELDAAGLAGTAFDMQLKLWFASASMYTEGLRPAAMDALQQALRIAVQLGDTDHRLRCLATIGLYEFFTGEHDAGLRTIEAFATLASTDDPSLLPECEVHFGIAELFLGRLQAARQRMEALQHRDLRYFGSHSVRYPSDPKVTVGCVLSQVQWLTGSPDTAMRTAADAIALAERTGHHLSLNNILSYACPVHYWSGSFEVCERIVRKLEAHVTQHGIVARRPLAAFYRAALDASGATPSAEVLGRMQQAIDDFFRTNHLARMPFYLSVLARTQLRAGFARDAAATVGHALALAHDQNEAWILPEVLRVQAGIVLALGRPVEAERRLLKSMAKAHAVGAQAWRLRAAVDLATLWGQSAKAPCAAPMLRAVLAPFTEGLATQDLRAAAALLDGMATPAPPQ